MKLNYLFVLGMSLTTLAQASSFKEIEPCGSAGVSEGSTCANAKVNFKFDGCKNNLPAGAAKSVTCEGDAILAKYQQGDFRYEARLKKSTDGWGAVSWNLDGTVKQFQREAPLPVPVAPKVVAKKVEPKIIAAVVMSEKKEESVAAPAIISPFKFGAFADVRYTNYHVKDNPLVTDGHPESGFGLEDGAFYANYDKDKLSVVLDVAFRRSKDVDQNDQTTTATKPNQSSNNNFAIGVDKSQLYMRYKVNPTVTFDIGQFDTIFGVELNDSKDRVFGKGGIVYDYTLPVTHMGFMTEFNFLGNYYIKAFGANPNNKGSNGSSTSSDDTVEVGAAVGFSNEFFHTQAGFMTRSIGKAAATSSGQRSLLDIIVGGAFGNFTYDLEYVSLNDASKNTLTASDSSDKETAATGYFTLLSYKITPDFQIGARFEYIQNDPTAQSKSTRSAGGSLHYKLTPELEIRTEYIAYKNKGIAGNKWDDSRFNFATVVVF
jgi:hypothetical protein